MTGNPEPAYASKRNRFQRVVHIALASRGRRPRCLCGVWMHTRFTPRPGRPITCRDCLRLWERGIRCWPPPDAGNPERSP
jgi:hypothetical protein